MRTPKIKAWSAGWFFLGILVASLVTCHAAAQGPCPFNPFAAFNPTERRIVEDHFSRVRYLRGKPDQTYPG